MTSAGDVATSQKPARPEMRQSGLGVRLTELEGLRAGAAVAVALTHAGFLSGAIGRRVLPGFLARMDIGVTIFFVLSGFLLYLPHARAHAGIGRPQHLWAYLSRRVARLLPASLAVLIGTAVLLPEARAASSAAWFANLAQLQGWRNSWLVPGLAQTWSLSTEIDFYVALPLLAWIAGRRWGRRDTSWTEPAILAAYAVGAWVFRLVASTGHLPGDIAYGQTLPAHLDWFAIGMLLAWLKVRPARFRTLHETVRLSATPLLVAAALVFWVCTTRLAGPYDLTPPTTSQNLIKHLGYGLVGALVLAPTTLGHALRWHRLLASGPAQFLGRISYGIFLWHMPVMFAVRHRLDLPLFGGGFWVTLLLSLALTIPLATLSWYGIEKPIQLWVRSRTAREPDAVLAPSAQTPIPSA